MRYVGFCCTSILFFLASQAAASASSLEATFNCYNSTTPPTQTASTGPLVDPFSCTTGPGNVGTFSGTVVSNYGSSGSLVNYAGGGSAYATADAFDVLSIASTSLPIGTPVALTLFGSLTGSYSYGLGAAGFVSDDIITQIALGAGFVLNTGEELSFCTALYSSTCGGNVSSSTGSGTVSIPFTSTTFDTTIGGPSFGLDTTFQQGLGGGGASVTFTGDFRDPFILTNIEVTNPTTGQLLSGVTITASSGVSYPVNVTSATPEPSTLALMTVAFIALIIRNSRSLRAEKWRNFF